MHTYRAHSTCRSVNERSFVASYCFHGRIVYVLCVFI